MTKREYILALLSELLDVWPMAKDLKVLVEENSLDDKILDALTNIFQEAVQHITDKAQRERLEKSIQILEKIKQREKEESEQELNNLDSMLDEI